MAWKSDSPDYATSSTPYGSTSTPTAKFCTKCKHQLEAGSLFCRKCGKEVKKMARAANACDCGYVFSAGDEYCGSCGRTRPAKSS